MLRVRIKCVDSRSEVPDVLEHDASRDYVGITNINVLKCHIINGQLHWRRFCRIRFFYLFRLESIYYELKIENCIRQFSFYFGSYILKLEILNANLIRE